MPDEVKTTPAPDWKRLLWQVVYILASAIAGAGAGGFAVSQCAPDCACKGKPSPKCECTKEVKCFVK